MTSLLPPTTRTRSRPGDRARRVDEGPADPAAPRPLVLVATLGGVLAAAGPLVVCLAVGVLGWFLTDAGAHGTPRGGLRTGALGWLLAHGSGVRVGGAEVGAVPLGLSLLCAWVVWRLAHRVGEQVSGHGPDADRLADGERDWTVATATATFAAGYAVVAVLTTTLAATTRTAPDTARVVGWSLLLCGLVGGIAVAVGSGRAALWATLLPPPVRATALTARRMLTTWLLVSTVAFLAALLVDLGTAVNVMSQLHTDAGDAAAFSLLSALLAPNAVLFAGSYLLGPGFTVGAGTLVSPTLVSVGALPMFPLLAALPDAGPTPVWTPGLLALAPLVAVVATVRTQRVLPTFRWDEGALRGCVGGALAGVVFGLLAALAGGAVGPGRMRDVGPLTLDATVHAVTAFAVGGLLAGLVMTWWQRRTYPEDPDLEHPDLEDPAGPGDPVALDDEADPDATQAMSAVPGDPEEAGGPAEAPSEGRGRGRDGSV